MTVVTHRIDVHAHAPTPSYTQALRDAGIDRIGAIAVPDWSPSAALAFMDR